MLLLRALTCRRCSSDVNEVNIASSTAPPQEREPQVARSEAQGHGKRGRLFLGYLLSAGHPGAGVATFTLSRKAAPPQRLSLGPGRPVSIDELANAMFRYGDALLASADGASTPFRAVDALLRHEPPRIAGVAPGAPLADPGANLLDQVVDIVGRMDETTLFLQGPPGAGKTYTGSRVLVHLLRQGKRIAVTSNSHHAINNLLAGVSRTSKTPTSIYLANRDQIRNPDLILPGQVFVMPQQPLGDDEVQRRLQDSSN